MVCSRLLGLLADHKEEVEDDKLSEVGWPLAITYSAAAQMTLL